MKKILLVCKFLVVLFWIVVVMNVFMPLPSPFYFMFIIFGVLSAVAHIVEALVFKLKNKTQDNMLLHIVKILVFGGFYLWGMKYETHEDNMAAGVS